MNIGRQKYRAEASSQAKFIRDSFLFSIWLVLGGLLRLLRAFFLAKWLGPQAFGTWTFVHIFSNYIPLSGLGTQRAVLRKVPFSRGRNDVAGIQTVLNTATTINVFGAIVYSVVVFAWSYSLQQPANAKALALYAPAILFVCWSMYGKTLFISTGLHESRRRLELLDVILASLFPLALGYWWGVYGAIAGLGIAACVVAFTAAYQLWPQFVFRIDWRIVRELFLAGLPILLNGLLLTTMRSVDRILIAALLNRELLGIYSIANAGIGILVTIPSSLGRMLFVKFAEMDGQSKTNENMVSAFSQSTIVLSSLFAPLVAMAVIVFPIAVVVLLPQFVQGIAAGKLLITSIFFIGISLPATNLCISTGRFKYVLALRVVVVTAEFIAVFFVIRNNMHLEDIALCVLCASAIFCVAMIIGCNHLFNQDLKAGIIRTGKSILPLCIIFTSFYIQNSIYPFDNNDLGIETLRYFIINISIILTISAPFIYLVNRRTQVFQKLVSNVRNI